MKRIVAFFLAVALALTSAAGLHFLAEHRVHADGNAFASWSGDGKFPARDAILKNLDENTILTFGSSEFQYGVMVNSTLISSGLAVPLYPVSVTK